MTSFTRLAFVREGSSYLKMLASIFAICFMFNNDAIANCQMNCVSHLNVSLNQDCNAIISYDMLVPNSYEPVLCFPTGPSAFVIIVTTAQGDTVAIGSGANAVVPGSYINQTLNVKIKHWSSGNSCTTTVTILDKKNPWIACPADITVACGTNINPSQNANIGNPSIMDCSSYTINYNDTGQDLGCSSPVKKIITRTYTVTDIYNNTITCSHRITLLRPTLNAVTFPANYDGIANPVIQCSGNVNTTPSVTGVPLNGGSPLITGGDCALEYSYNDQITNFCPNSYMIIRSWTVVEWCSNAVRTGTQIIKVMDTQPPTITCPAPIVVAAAGSGCGGNVVIPPAVVSDNCSSNVSVTVQGPQGMSLPTNGGTFTNFPSGSNVIRYTATDACGNTATCTTTINFQDNAAPNVVCHQNLTATLTSNGTVIVFAQALNAGSTDNCCGNQLTYAVKRMNQADSAFGPSITFTCADIGQVINLILRVTDCNGNFGICMVQITIQDKTAPVLTCPNNVTISCGENANTHFTTPAVSEGCSYTLDSNTVTNVDMCGAGFVKRNWIATDNSGNTGTCAQTVFVQHVSNFTVQFPLDFTTNNCDQNIAPSITGEPVTGNQDCEMIALSFTDELFYVVPDACYKVYRTWKVINWCNFNINNSNNTNLGIPLGNNTFQDDGDGYFRHVQVIKVIDNVPPVMTCPANQTIAVGPNCTATVTIPQPTASDVCSDQVTVTASSSLGNGFGPFNNVAIGNYTVTYTAADGCGNITTCQSVITVKDNKKPTPYCLSGIVTTLMPMDTNGDGVSDQGMIEIWASDLNLNSYDNCTPSNQLNFSFSADTTDTNRTFTCENVVLNGPNFVELWVTDAAGNQDFCITYIIIQDNMGACPSTDVPAASGIVAGNITTEMGQNIQNVNVTVNSNNATTGANGNYNFPGLAYGNNYTVKPVKNTEILNGVTTIDLVLMKKHLLGTELLNSPYKIIAADVNKSGSITTIDMVELRKAILGMITEFPNNTSWRFVDKNYTFSNPTLPLAESFPEQYNITNLNSTMNINFMGVKIGDLNNTAITNQLGSAVGNRTQSNNNLSIDDINVEAGKSYSLAITLAENQSNLLGLQFQLDYNPTQIEVQNIEGKLPNMDENNYLHDGRGAVRFSWESGEAVQSNGNNTIVNLTFVAFENAKLSDLLKLNNEIFNAEIYSDNNNQVIADDLKLNWRETDSNVMNGFELLPNSPNPFTNGTTIQFNLPEDEIVGLQFVNTKGVQLNQLKVEGKKGLNNVIIHANDLNNEKGMITYRLISKNGTLVSKLLRVE